MAADLEKSSENLAVVETAGSDSSGVVNHASEKKETLEGIDLANRQAFKGDDSDGKVEWTFRKLLAAASLAMLYTGSQIPLYFAGSTLSFIADDVHNADAIGWIPVANTLTISAICPFVGYLQDLFGKRYIALFGAIMLCVGCVVVSTAHSLGAVLAGMAVLGGGGSVGELTGLAGLAEMVPVKHRGYSMATLTAFVLPFTPYILYTELFAHSSTWRWGFWIGLMYKVIAAVGLLSTYFPHAHTRAQGLSRRAIIKRIDFLGGALSITGLTLLLVALQSGGYDHAWNTAYVLCPLIFGLLLLATWAVYEARVAKTPMVPPELFMGQRVTGLSFFVAFVAAVYDPVPVKIGLRGLPVSLSIILGAIFWNAMLSRWKGGAEWILLIASTIMTAFGGSLAVMTPENEVATVALCICAGFGIGGVLVPAATVAMIAAPDALITTCAALSLSIRAVGGAIGYSIYYNVFAGKLKVKLPALVASYAIQAGLPVSEVKAFLSVYLTVPTEAAGLPGVTAEVLAGALKGSQWAYAESLRYVWLTSTAFGVLAMIASVCIPNARKFETNRIAVGH